MFLQCQDWAKRLQESTLLSAFSYFWLQVLAQWCQELEFLQRVVLMECLGSAKAIGQTNQSSASHKTKTVTMLFC